MRLLSAHRFEEGDPHALRDITADFRSSMLGAESDDE